MKYTSAEVAKLLRLLNEKHAGIRELERKSAVFTAAIEENIEDVRPEYDYKDIQSQLAELEEKIRVVKHLINSFNLVTTVPGYDMTVDQMLVYIPQLSEKKRKLSEMACRIPRERVSSGYGKKAIVEYEYANYNIPEVRAELLAVTDELSRAQTALDVVNNSMSFEIDIE